MFQNASIPCPQDDPKLIPTGAQVLSRDVLCVKTILERHSYLYEIFNFWIVWLVNLDIRATVSSFIECLTALDHKSIYKPSNRNVLTRHDLLVVFADALV